MENQTRIANIPKSGILAFYLSLDSEELNELVKKSSGQEINRLFSHLNENLLNDAFAGLSNEGINAVFSRIPKNRINKYLLLASESNVRKIVAAVSDETKLKILTSSSSNLRKKLLSTLPAKYREEWKSLLNEQELLNREINLITSSQIDNSFERESLERYRNIEQQAQLRQEQYEARIQQSEVHLANINQQIANSEKQLHEQQTKAKREQDLQKKREYELAQRLQKLKDEHEKEIQSRIDIKVPEYVENAIEGLEKKENEYKEKAKEWSDKGSNAIKFAVGAALVALAYGAFEFSSTPKTEVSWLFFGYLMLKGLIVIGLFAAWAKHAFNQSNAYMHEALKRSERTHAISFGKLYLEIYGNDVSKEDMKSIFENWNMESKSAFKDIKQEDFQPQTLDKLKDIIGVMKTNSAEKPTEATNK